LKRMSKYHLFIIVIADLHSISDLESKLGAGLIEEVIQVAEGEHQIVETMIKAKMSVTLLRHSCMSSNEMQLGTSRGAITRGPMGLLRAHDTHVNSEAIDVHVSEVYIVELQPVYHNVPCQLPRSGSCPRRRFAMMNLSPCNACLFLTYFPSSPSPPPPAPPPPPACSKASLLAAFLFPKILTVFCFSMSDISPQFPILERLPSLLTTNGPRWSSFTVFPPVLMSMVVVCRFEDGEGRASGRSG
jgi:hypothetical protein